MAYDLETKEKARMMWLKGISFENIAKELGSNLTTIFNWSVEGVWKDDLEEIQKEIKKKSNEKVIDDIDKMNQIHLAQLTASHTLIRDARQRVAELLATGTITEIVEEEDASGKIILKTHQRPMTPLETRSLTGAVRDLAAALDTTLKDERLIRNVTTEKKEITGELSWKSIIYESERILNE